MGELMPVHVLPAVDEPRATGRPAESVSESWEERLARAKEHAEHTERAAAEAHAALVQTIRDALDADESASAVARQLGVSRTTLYRYLKDGE